MSSPEPLNRIVTKFGHLRQLAAEARRLGRLNEDLEKCLPATVADHVTLAAIQDGCLVLRAENAAWASKIRYRAPEILAALRNSPEFGEVRSIRVRNHLPAVRATREPQRARMSNAAGSGIAAQAAGIKDDELRAALLRLAARGGTSD